MKINVDATEVWPFYYLDAKSEGKDWAMDVPDDLVERYRLNEKECDDIQDCLRSLYEQHRPPVP